MNENQYMYVNSQSVSGCLNNIGLHLFLTSRNIRKQVVRQNWKMQSFRAKVYLPQ